MLSTVQLATARHALPRGNYHRLIQEIESLATQLEAAGDSLRHFVGGRSGVDPALLAIGERLVVWRSIPERYHEASTLTASSEGLSTVLVSPERQVEAGQAVRDLTVLGGGWLVELLDGPAAAIAQMGASLNRGR